MFKHFREFQSEQGCRDARYRHGRGWWDDRQERSGGFGGGRERFFDNGHLRLVILQLIADKPSYGYEIIKAIEERFSGGYAPSPGVVYPTLTLLEEEGMAIASADGNKKRYAATEEGNALLAQNKPLLDAIFGRMREAGQRFGRGRNPQVERAMMNLVMAIKMRAKRGDLTPDQARKIAEAIDAAAQAIDQV